MSDKAMADRIRELVKEFNHAQVEASGKMNGLLLDLDLAIEGALAAGLDVEIDGIRGKGCRRITPSTLQRVVIKRVSEV